MNALAWDESGRARLLMGAVLLYTASRAAAESLAGKTRSPGKTALAHWMPVAVAAMAALLVRRADLALCIIFCTSVASLSLVQGTIVLMAPRDEAPPDARRVWPFALVTALMTLLAGFAGRLTWVHALIFLGEGAVLLAVWMDLNRQDVPLQPQPLASSRRTAWVILSVIMAVVGAAIAVRGAVAMSRPLAWPSANVIIVVILGPLLTVPMLFGAAELARQKQAAVATTTSVGLVLLNLCLLLPAVVLLRYPISALHRDPTAPLRLRMDPLGGVTPMVFSLVTWRVDNVVLVLLGFILLPPALGRWRLGRSEGITLLGLYVAYVLMEIVADTRM